MEPVIIVSLAIGEGVYLDALRDSLCHKGPFSINICAHSGLGLIEQLEQSVEATDVLLLHSRMLFESCDLHETVKKRWPQIRTLILSPDDTIDIVGRLVKQHVNGILCGDSGVDVLTDAILTIYHKGIYYNHDMPTYAVNMMMNSIGGYAHFTQNEIAVLRHMPDDLTYKEVALKTGMSKRAVEGYRDSLFNKLNTRSRQGLAKFALKYGLTKTSGPVL